METVALNVRAREETGKGVARSLRRQAQLPAVFYGRGIQPVPLAVKAGEVDKLISSAAGENVLIDLNIERGGSTQSHRAMIKEIQVDPLQQNILHVDFYAISMDEKISLEVPVTLTGEAVGVSEGGILQQVRRSIEVNCLPDQIPEAFEVDVSNLAIGDSLHVSDLEVPEGVEVLAEERLTLASVVPPAKEEEIIAEIPEEEEEREEVEEEEVTETKEEGDKE